MNIDLLLPTNDTGKKVSSWKSEWINSSAIYFEKLVLKALEERKIHLKTINRLLGLSLWPSG